GSFTRHVRSREALADNRHRSWGLRDRHSGFRSINSLCSGSGKHGFELYAPATWAHGKLLLPRFQGCFGDECRASPTWPGQPISSVGRKWYRGNCISCSVGWNELQFFIGPKWDNAASIRDSNELTWVSGLLSL